MIISRKLIGYDASEVMNKIQKLEENYCSQSDKLRSKIKALEDEISKLEANKTGKDEGILVELLLRKYMGLVKVIYEEDRKSKVIDDEEARKLRELEYEYSNVSESLKKYMEKVKGIIESYQGG